MPILDPNSGISRISDQNPARKVGPKHRLRITAKVTAAQQAKQLACSNYAAAAVGQEKENLSRQCGFSGGRWSADYNAHFNWCMSVGPSKTTPETTARVVLLTTKCTYTECSTHTEVVAGIPPFKIVKTCVVKLKPAH